MLALFFAIHLIQYTDPKCGYSFSYPDSWRVEARAEEDWGPCRVDVEPRNGSVDIADRDAISIQAGHGSFEKVDDLQRGAVTFHTSFVSDGHRWVSVLAPSQSREVAGIILHSVIYAHVRERSTLDRSR